MERRIDVVRAAQEHPNPSQTDRSRMVLPFDPQANDPFLMLVEDWFSARGFGWHPHRGFETVSVVLEGHLEHQDNAGGRGILGPGPLQWTTTGSGVLHAELAHERKPVHMLQLWLNLPGRLKMSPPRYQDLRAAEAPVVQGAGAEARVFAGEVQGRRGRAQTLWPATAATIRLDGGGSFVHEVPGDHAAFLYVAKGRIRVAGAEVAEGHSAWSAPGEPGRSTWTIEAAEPSQVVAFSGLPIREPVAARGPFVMNRPEELVQAIRDYQAGRFGAIPA